MKDKICHIKVLGRLPHCCNPGGGGVINRYSNSFAEIWFPDKICVLQLLITIGTAKIITNKAILPSCSNCQSSPHDS